jgi:hypothetical protein
MDRGFHVLLWELYSWIVISVSQLPVKTASWPVGNSIGAIEMALASEEEEEGGSGGEESSVNEWVKFEVEYVLFSGRERKRKLWDEGEGGMKR